MNRLWRVTVLLLVGFAASGCGFGGEKATGPGIIGTWDGEYVDDFNNLQRLITITIDRQTQDIVTGSYKCTGSATAVCTHPAATGTVNGLITDDRIVARVRADGNSTFTCDYSGVISADAIQGTFSCSDSTDTGTFRVFRS